VLRAPKPPALAQLEKSGSRPIRFSDVFVAAKVSRGSAIPDWVAIIGMYTQIADVVFSDAVRRDGHISASRLLEAQTLCSTYLSMHLPPSLPARATGNTD